MIGSWALLLNLSTTLMMTGLIWFVQIVHYPLFDQVGAAVFGSYHQSHVRQTTLVVGPAMVAEGVTGALLFWVRPEGVGTAMVGVGLALLVVIWLSTRVLQIPQHKTLSSGFDGLAHGRLVAGNWLRTLAWTIRGGLVLGMVWAVLVT